METPTEKPDLSRRRFSLGPTPLTSKKNFVTETTTEANPLTCRRLEREVNTTLHLGEHRMTRRPKKMFSAKHSTKIGTWNVRTSYQNGKSQQVAEEMDRYQQILVLSEVRWNTSGMTTLATDHTIIYYGNSDTNDIHDKGVGFMLTKKAKRSLLQWNPVSARIITARFDTKFQNTTLIQVYSPTINANEDDKDDFYNSLQTTIIPKRDSCKLVT